MLIDHLPRVSLSEFPTPIDYLERFSRYLQGPQILMKRDDLTTLCMGGNKARKLEFIMADALKEGADVIITTGGVQTNHGRLTAAAANKLGLKPVLVLSGKEPEKYTGNLLLDYLLGADLHFVAPDRSLPQQERAERLKRDVEQRTLEVKSSYEAKGHKCYVIPLGGAMSVATAGYLNCMLELKDQFDKMQKKADYLVVVTGSTSTTSSLIFASKAFNTGIKVIGISVWMSAEECRKKILEDLKRDAKFYNFDVSFTPEEITIFDDYIGEGYGIPSKECLRAVKLLAETESIIVDYSYTGKGLAGLIDLTRKGFFKKDDTVVFLHTGGAPAIFNLNKEDFEKALR